MNDHHSPSQIKIYPDTKPAIMADRKSSTMPAGNLNTQKTNETLIR